MIASTRLPISFILAMATVFIWKHYSAYLGKLNCNLSRGNWTMEMRTEALQTCASNPCSQIHHRPSTAMACTKVDMEHIKTINNLCKIYLSWLCCIRSYRARCFSVHTENFTGTQNDIICTNSRLLRMFKQPHIQ